jgi:hypothetical protein
MMNLHTRSISILRKWILPAILLVVTAGGSTSCTSFSLQNFRSNGISPNVSPENQEPITSGCDILKITTSQVHWFKDSGGAWRVVGILQNNSSEIISKIELGVETRTSTDQPADQGEDVSAYPLDLQPGQQAPFTSWLDRDIPDLDHFEVEVDDCVLAEPEEHGLLSIQSGHVVVDDNGIAQVTAELVNPSAKTILVNGLMAAVYDQSGVMITDDYSKVTPRVLAPGESGPVRVSLELPPQAASKVSTYQLFMDVLINQPAPLSVNVKQDVQLLSHYIDKDGHFHQLGQITNPTSTGLMTSLQATVYADSLKSQVADAAEFSTALPLMPGETRPFDLDEWGALNHTAGLWEQLAGENASIDLRLEPFLTWTTAATAVSKLSILNTTITFDNQQAFFTGKVENDTGSGITNGLVTAIVRQKSNQQVVAAGTTQLDITDSAVPGQIMDYSIIIPLPANLDPATLLTEVIAEGTHP